MGASSASMLARAELRRRWGSLLGMAALVMLVTTAVLTAVVGAHRSSTAVDRFRTWAGASDIEYQSDELVGANQMLDVARAQPAVEQAGLRHLLNVWPTDGSADIALMSDPEDVYGTRIDRPRMLVGRMPAPDAPDEIMLNELAAEVTGLHVGDHVDANTWSEDDLNALAGDGFPGFNGPRLDLVVVGIGRTPDELSGTLRRTAPYAIGSPSFLGNHPGIGAWPPAVEVRLRDGASTEALGQAISEVQRQQTGIETPGGFHTAATSASDVYLDAAHTATNSLVIGLLLFVAAAALAGGLAVGQAVQRQLAGSVNPSRTLAALGLTRAEIAWARSWPIAASAAVGVVVGAALAVAASPLLPIGLVRRAEIDPGVWVDPLVLIFGAVVILALVWGWALLVARRQARIAPQALAVRRPPFMARVAARAGASPSLATGLRLASDRRRRSESVPVRSAVAGVAIAVTGLLVAGVVSTSFGELSGTPAHWGVPWSSSPDYFGDEPMGDLATRLADDDRVEALGRYATATMVLDDQAISASSLETVKGNMQLTRLKGRLPTSPTEIALGAGTLGDLGLSIGDTVATIPRDGGHPVPLTVVGTAVLPATDEYTIDVGAVVTRQGMARFGQGDVSETPVLVFPAGADVVSTEEGLANDYGLDFNLFTEPRPQGSITNLAEPRDIGVALAGFLALLGAVGMLHALLVSTRRRRGDLGVLRALGLRGRQAERAVVVEALALTAAGLVVGIPAGLIVGRAVWQNLVANLGAISESQLPWLLVVAVVPATAMVAASLAYWPARRVRAMSPADALRVE